MAADAQAVVLVAICKVITWTREGAAAAAAAAAAEVATVVTRLTCYRLESVPVERIR